MHEPTFLVEAPNGKLYGYMRPDILRIDLATNRENPPNRIFRLDRSSLAIAYEPIQMSELIPAGEAAAAPAEIETTPEPLLLKA